MRSRVIPQNTNLKWPSWRASIAVVLLAAAFFYIWILPILRPRGPFFWGHYRLKDVYLGIPIGLATLGVVVLSVIPAAYRRPLAMRLATLSVAVLGALFVADAAFAFGVMRVWRADFWLDQAHISRRYSIPDGELGFVRKPFVSWRGYVPEADRTVDYRADENGFRNPTGKRAADILFIGDSYTESATVGEEDTFVRRVEKASGLSVVNLGRGAYGPQQELIVLKRYGRAYKPHFVVWQLFEGNDLEDAEQFAAWKINPQQVNTTLTQRYFENSLLKQWLTRTSSQAPGGAEVTLAYPNGTSRRVRLKYRYQADQPTMMSLGMTETLRTIEEGQRWCQSNGALLLIVFVPTMVRVMGPQISFDRADERKEYLPEQAGGNNDFSGRMNQFCGQIGCHFVDSIEAMRRSLSSDNRNLYIPTDEHLDIKGHEVLSSIIVDWIRSTDVAAHR